MKIDFQEQGHRYTLDGRFVPSVSQIINIDQEPCNCDAEMLKYAGDLGTAVHLACELWDKGVLKMSSVDPVVAPRLEAWKRFRADYKPKFLHIEALIGSKVHGFAGKCDRSAIMQGKPCIIDLKTGVISPTTRKQLGGYAIGYKERFSLVIRRLYACQLLANGNYKVFPYEVRVSQDDFMRSLNEYKRRILNGN